jgi:hypothetical protein
MIQIGAYAITRFACAQTAGFEGVCTQHIERTSVKGGGGALPNNHDKTFSF